MLTGRAFPVRTACPARLGSDERRTLSDERQFPESGAPSTIPSVIRPPPRLPLPCRRVRGFTLIELMIAVVVVAVLLSLALPSLMGSIRKSRRAEAFTKLNAVQLAQERFRANSPTYATSLSNGAASAPPGLALPATTNDGRYTIALDGVPTATTYAAVATPIQGSSQVDDGDCARLRLQVNSGNTVYESAPTGGAFSEALGHRCWVR